MKSDIKSRMNCRESAFEKIARVGDRKGGRNIKVIVMKLSLYNIVGKCDKEW